MRKYMRPSWFVLIAVGLLLGMSALSGCARTGQPAAPSGGGSQATTRTMVLETVQQWVSSRHSIVDTLPVTEDGCKNCHNGYMFSITGGGFKPRVQPGSTGATGSTSATGSTGASGTTGGSTSGTSTALVALVPSLPPPTDCRACHTGVGAQIADAGTVEQIPSIPSANGGRGAVCMACHNGWHPAGKAANGDLEAPHLSTQTDVLYGVNFVDPGGASSNATATQSPHLKIENTCVGCHMAPAGGRGGANHTFKVKDFGLCQAQGCHQQDMTGGGMARADYDGNGKVELTTQEVEGLVQKLKSAIENDAGPFMSARGMVVFTAKRTVSDSTYAAAYNYFYIVNDKSRGIHNARFVIDLLTRSIKAVGGSVGSGTGGGSGSSGTTGSSGATGSQTTTP